MKKLLLPCFLFFAIATFAQNSSFKINGTVTNDFDGYLYLKYGDKMDSVKVKDKKFTFEGAVDYPIEAILFIQEGFFHGSLYLENSNMDISVTITPPITVMNSISGNESAEISKNLKTYFESIEGDPDFSEKLYKKLYSVFSENPKNQMFGELLSDIAMDPIFSKEQLINLLAILDKKTLDKRVIESLNTSIRKFSKYKVGTKMPTIELPNEQGKIIKLSDLRGKVVLVDFWASWCVPCRENNKELKSIYQKYNSLGFEILGVSIENNKADWLKALRKDKVEWINTKTLNDKLSQELGIQYVPSNFLISREGKILAINIQPKLLEQKLSELFK